MKNQKESHLLKAIFLLLSFIVIFSSCKKEDDPSPDLERENLYAELKQWYYWNHTIPNIDPSSYSTLGQILEAIRYKPLDRWSFITEWDEFYAYISRSEFVGYGFGSKWDSQGKLRVTFVYNSVAMYQEGVRRSWIVDAINGTPVNPQTSLASLLGPDQVGTTNTFRFLKPDGELVNLSFSKEVITMNTVLHHEVIQLDDIKVGYLVFQGFTGTSAEELKTVFQIFNQQQVDELILDMRYNGGGLTSVARELASLIGGNSLVGEVFSKNTFNDNNSHRNSAEVFTDEANSLSLTRLITICTRATASSSELIINGLRPYMDVIIVGDDTYGKPMGANVLRFNEKWALVPITFKTKNANDEGDFFDGLPADILANDGLHREFGHPDETSLQQALAFISTGVAKAAPVEVIPYSQPLEEKWGLRRLIGAW